MISLSRILAVFAKELVQMRRDRLTFAIMIMVPIMQLALFGFAIDTDPRHLPTAVELKDDGPLTRSFLASLRQSAYVDIVTIARREGEGERLLRAGKISFLIVVPENFERDFVRGARPEILFAADATDPVASSGAIAAAREIAARAFAPELDRLPTRLRGAPAPFEIIVHRRYNPAGVTAFNIVPGLLGVILTMTLIMITSIALTRENERGTIEALLSTPVLPVEVMIGKTTPYILVGVIQTAIVLGAAAHVFRIPFEGAPGAFALAAALFIFTNLMLGYMISTVAKTQMQAMQMTFFVFLPSILLSGFMFPFAAMPGWAQAIGQCLPITHFLRIVREVMLKGAGLADITGDLVPLAVIFAVLAVAALTRFRRTLD
ncbi:ABC transporter permease [Amphiplicatus metriothermophilus]|uniref:ABC-2 type transport system permease protein n=1 Tax=Amphiplicatus metriothermophilus TaxID=1519374 RepID=A0A239PPG6_9PROT|nr:ABC transporter permease [Amphiplicatus metriothermophilus]MBB5518805.1 ABC-2 type transport system permease protein [Amphiplicatus metriothermophilus]SNT72040.1 ABC-2 type transport system permease protein [Amphiplicatus metriothermophilus]